MPSDPEPPISTRTRSKSIRSSPTKPEGDSIIPQLLILGFFSNCYLLYTLHHLPWCSVIPNLSRCFIFVNAFRCVWPNRYNKNVVLHDTPLSSIFLTRLLATFSEVAWLLLLGLVAMQYAPFDEETEIPFLYSFGAGLLPGLCAMAQCFVWSSLILRTDSLMFYEESTWLVMFILNTSINAYIWFHGVRSPLVIISLVFGFLYLPWQAYFHLGLIVSLKDKPLTASKMTLKNAKLGLVRACKYRNKTKKLVDWGGWTGVTWMVAYWWAEPVWIAAIAWVMEKDGKIV
uniref:Uncharacterized protein n=1 Tax=Chromera velia CCMP2878 TaxID=1169474 RepID=A0A0G4G6R1_9ALVE|eukprot:Cvel_20475.t1-p1 / transcript=Cvel_20475.t1 / gene=Cvel_20475 / organism=Chromera_velia_CCMP2878 / gene_product=hypothetical protein / transcript_product=hypothetical protein / location=Cvel_scaffold1839:34830-35687(-) / protein_length=286 / sequence_SO=supercontig / SO=protein_coding / is_pseudo=false